MREGVCFKCWGSGDDLEGSLKAAEKALKQLRAEWVRLNRASKGSQGLKKDALLEAMAQVTLRGLAYQAQAEKLQARLEHLRQINQPIAG